MAEPKCKIEWFYEGYQSVWVYIEGEADLHDLCGAIAEAIQEAHDVAAVDRAVESVALGRGYTVETYPGPSSADPLALTVRIGLRRAN